MAWRSHEWQLTGVPYTSARDPGGMANAVAVLRELGLASTLAGLGVEDGGDLSLGAASGERGASGLLNEEALTELVLATCASVRETHARGRTPLLVGGDCPVVLGPLAAIDAAGERPGLVMIDGHEDAWPPTRSQTGEGSDSEVAIALGRVPALPIPLAEAVAVLAPSAIVQVGPRDLAEIDAAGVPSLRDEAAFYASADEVASDLPETLMTQALAAIDADGFWLHVDLDALASADFAAVDYPQAGGLSWDQLDRLTAASLRDDRCRGLSVVIYNPELDPDRVAAQALIDFLDRLGGRGRPPVA